MSTHPSAAPSSSKRRAAAQGQRPGSQSSPSKISEQASFLFSQPRAAWWGREGGLRKCFFRWTARPAVRLPASSQEQGNDFSGPQAWV